MESYSELMLKILKQEKEINDLKKRNQSLENNLKVSYKMWYICQNFQVLY